MLEDAVLAMIVLHGQSQAGGIGWGFKEVRRACFVPNSNDIALSSSNMRLNVTFTLKNSNYSWFRRSKLDGHVGPALQNSQHYQRTFWSLIERICSDQRASN
jgi:hypothetical protein